VTVSAPSAHYSCLEAAARRDVHRIHSEAAVDDRPAVVRAGEVEDVDSLAAVYAGVVEEGRRRGVGDQRGERVVLRAAVEPDAQGALQGGGALHGELRHRGIRAQVDFQRRCGDRSVIGMCTRTK
jgi:hypothetical protein